ncbi:MAG: HAMP domain-containing protein [Methylococcaceae bacterium]|nr:HAMP domain-containing protein [Methylococcaceae bacterium]
MKAFFDELFGKLLLWQKFFILGLIAIILVLIPFGFYLVGMTNDIKVAEHEITGIKPSLAILKLEQLTQQHRSLSSQLLGGNTASSAAREAKEKETNDAIAAMDTALKGSVNDNTISKEWGVAKQHWQNLLDQVKNAKISASQSDQEHTSLIEAYLAVLDKIADYTELSLDPVSESYFMMRAALYSTPKMVEAMAKTSDLGTALLKKKEADPAQVATLSGYVYLVNTNQEETSNQLQKTFSLSPSVKENLESLSQNSLNLVDNSEKLVKDEIINKQELSYDSKTYFDTFTTAINAIFKLNEQSIEQLEGLLQVRKKELTNELLTVSFGLLVLFALGLFMGYLITGSVSKPIGHLVSVMQKLAGGEGTVRANMQSFDEIGALGRQFDMMVDQRELVSTQIQQENDTMNNSIIDMLQAVGAIAQKDLTVKAPVAEDITGPLGDALNYLTDETAKVLNKVVRIAGEVATVSNLIKTQSDTVMVIASGEKSEVNKSAIELGAASVAMRDIATLALSCNEAAAKAINNTDKAQETVLGTVQGITSIRDTIRETEKRIKRLGERSQEIGSVVTIINGIAERTHILALNASMHAASAGEAGKGFAVVANEVQKLAENAREATQQISGLVNNIQVETADTVTNMNDAITQVVRGTTLAQQAGNEMRETRDTTAELVQLVQRIAESSKTQAETSQRLQERSAQIQKASEQTFNNLQEQGKETERLVEFSGNLVESVSVFKLPSAR